MFLSHGSCSVFISDNVHGEGDEVPRSPLPSYNCLVSVYVWPTNIAGPARLLEPGPASQSQH